MRRRPPGRGRDARDESAPAERWLNRRALEFVNRRRTKPFLLYLSHKALHVPYLPAKRHESLYAGAKYVPPASAGEDLSGKPVLRRAAEPVGWSEVEGVAPEPPESRRGRGRDRDSVVRDRQRTLAAVDEGVGQLVRALGRRGQLDDTVFIFTSDNGYLLGEHGQFDNKRSAYEESIRVPFILRYPKLAAAGTTVGGLALNVDVAPTPRMREELERLKRATR